MRYLNERRMYKPVCQWLRRFLSERHRDARVQVHDVSRRSLSAFIDESKLREYLPAEWVTWDIRVDIVGFIIKEGEAQLAFAECKNNPITLAHVSQLLGYSRVARPLYSFLLSPAGTGDSLVQLIETYRRTDVLQYDWQTGIRPRTILIAKWDHWAGQIEVDSTLPQGAFMGHE